MYARVARFEGDPGTVDELVEALRVRDAGLVAPGARRSLLLADRESGARLGIVLFESSEAMRAAEQAFESLGDEIPEEVRGRRTDVHGFEVVLEQVGEGPRAASVITLEGSPDGLEDGVLALNEFLVPEARDLTGWRGLLVLADRGTGATRVVLLWDELASLVASDEAGGELRRKIAAALAESVTAVERFEVALHEAPVAVPHAR